MNINCIIVDDEPLAIEILETYISTYEGITIVAKCNSAIEAYNELQKNKVDLMFLDIQMPQMNGLEFLNSLKEKPLTVLCTAYSEYALESYNYNVLDYLVKPVSFERFLKTIDKAKTRLGQQQQQLAKLTPEHHANDLSKENESFLYFKSDKKTMRVNKDDVLYIESVKDYVKIVTKDDSYLTLQSISFLEDNLSKDLFVRVHRSFIVAKNKVNAVASAFIEVGKHEIPIGRSYKKNVDELIKSDLSF